MRASLTFLGEVTGTPTNYFDVEPPAGPRRVRELLGRLAPGEDVDAILRGRYAIFNVWRPINGVVEQWPLAICDMRSMKTDDFVDAELKWPHRTGYVCAVRHSPHQHWLHVSAMNVDEALVFKCYDSVPDESGARFGAHTGFADPTSRADARTRESIEVRAIALFG